jgi:integrase/recombinase XerD
MDIVIYTRHSADCPKLKERYWRRCRCPKWLAITDETGRTLRSAKTRSWETAEAKRVDMLRSPHSAPLLEHAVDKYLDNLRGLKRKPATIYRNKLILGRLQSHCGHIYLDQINLSKLEEFRNTWKVSDITAHFDQNRIKAFFSYCNDHHWTQYNPAVGLAPFNPQQPPTMPFTQAEYFAMLEAAKKPLTNLFIRVLRWSGLAIGDAIRLDRSRLIDGRLLLRRAKTGVPVFCPLPEDVGRDLAALAGPYFFWKGRSNWETCRKGWYVKLRRVCKKAGIEHSAHPHMLRNTFAVELLLAEVPIEDVSALLGHADTKTTLRYYAPWVQARQERLEASVRKSWLTS